MSIPLFWKLFNNPLFGEPKSLYDKNIRNKRILEKYVKNTNNITKN